MYSQLNVTLFSKCKFSRVRISIQYILDCFVCGQLLVCLHKHDLENLEWQTQISEYLHEVHMYIGYKKSEKAKQVSPVNWVQQMLCLLGPAPCSLPPSWRRSLRHATTCATIVVTMVALTSPMVEVTTRMSPSSSSLYSVVLSLANFCRSNRFPK